MKGGRWRESMMNLFQGMYTDRIALGIGPLGGSGVLIGVKWNGRCAVEKPGLATYV
jgi:hypothetical protein